MGERQNCAHPSKRTRKMQQTKEMMMLILTLILTFTSTIHAKETQEKCYVIISKDSSRALTQGSDLTKLVQFDYQGVCAQKFRFLKVAENTYNIQNIDTDQFLSWDRDSRDLSFNDFANSDNQEWVIKERVPDDPAVLIQGKGANRCLDMPYARLENDVEILGYSCHGGINQLFYVNLVVCDV